MCMVGGTGMSSLHMTDDELYENVCFCFSECYLVLLDRLKSDCYGVFYGQRISELDCVSHSVSMEDIWKMLPVLNHQIASGFTRVVCMAFRPDNNKHWRWELMIKTQACNTESKTKHHIRIYSTVCLGMTLTDSESEAELHLIFSSWDSICLDYLKD